MKILRIHQQAVLVALLGVVAVAGGALLVSCSHSGSGEPATVASSEGTPLAARVDQLDGEVGLATQTTAADQNPAEAGTPNPPAGNTGTAAQETGWTKATVNAPVSVGSRIYVKENSKCGIAFSGRNYARLNPNTSLDVLSLAQRRTQCALRQGSGVFSVGALAPDELFEIATPNGAVDCVQPGLYQIGFDDSGSVLVSVLSGLARVVGQSGSAECGKGQLLTLAAAAASEAVVSQLAPTVAGGICDDYYSNRYPRTYDGRYADYNRYLDDTYYYDPYRRSVSHQYIPDDSEVAGLDDLDGYGDWSDVPKLGHCWHPREASGWAPYRDGYWHDDRSLGLTWVASERWGWAPYHYGRWSFVNNGWYWVPGEVVTRPVYAPALVAFVQMPEPDRVGWVPLGPGDPYVPRYYDANHQPQYIGSRTEVNKYTNITNIVNYNVPGAVTVVQTNEFTRVITPAVVQTADPAVLARTRPVVDPFGVPSVRELAPHMMAVRPAVAVPVVAEQAFARPVMTSQNPVVPGVAAHTVQTLKVQPVSEETAKQKLRVNDSGQTVAVRRPDGLPVAPINPGQPGQPSGQPGQQAANDAASQARQARMAQLAPQAAAGNKEAKRAMLQLENEQRIQDKMARKAAAGQGTPQQPGLQPGSQPAQQGQTQEQRKAEKQAARQQAEQAAQQRQTQAEQLAAQQKAQKQAARQQAQQQAQQAAQQQQQQKAERRAQRQNAAQQQPQQATQEQQQQQQQKAARRAQRQNAAQQQPQQATQEQQQQQQQKAARRAQRQSQQQNAEQASPSKAEKKAKNKNSEQ